MVDLDLGQLRAFAAVCDSGSVSAAAHKVHVTQPALSRRISELESSLGVQLFERERGRLRLTSAGENLLEHARGVLIEAESMVTRARTFGRDPAHVLRVGSSSIALERVIAPVLHRYRRAHPDVEVRLVEGGGPELFEKVVKGELHLTFSVPLDRRLEVKLLFPHHTLAVSSASYRIPSRGRTVRLEDVVEQRLLMLPRVFVHRRAFDAACELMRIKPNIVFESGVSQSLLALARIGFGVAIVPSIQDVGAAGLRAHVVVYQGHSMGSWMGLSWDRRRFVPDYMRDFMDEIERELRERSPHLPYRKAPPLMSARNVP